VARPSLILLDEPTSALDVSVQASIVNVLDHLRRGYQRTAFILVTHDLALTRQLAARIVVLDRGTVAEAGPAEQVLKRPTALITQSLLGWSYPQNENSRSQARRNVVDPNSWTTGLVSLTGVLAT
jgi:ABC-type glutathione transport system ATPase component